MNSNQWMHNGDCSKCRKKPYCTKQCSANKKALRKAITDAAYSTMLKRIDKANKRGV